MFKKQNIVTRGKKVLSRSIFRPRTVIGIVAGLLSLNVIFFGVMFAKYRSASDSSQASRAAGFDPVIRYGDAWEQELELSGVLGLQDVVLPFEIDNENTEVAIKATVNVSCGAVLPLECLLYVCEETQIETELPLIPVSSAGGEIVYEVELASGERLPCTLVIRLNEELYREYMSGLTETASVHVKCEQID